MKTELELLKADRDCAYITSTPFILLDNQGVPFTPVFRAGKTTGEIIRSMNPLTVTGYSRENADHLALHGNGVRVVSRIAAIEARIAALSI